MNSKGPILISTVLLALVLGSLLRLPRAGAQSGAALVTVIDSATEHPSHLAVDSSGRLFYFDGASWQFLVQGPAGRPVDLRLAAWHGNNYILSMENGDVYTFLPQVLAGPIEFTYMGNVFAGPVSTKEHSWGAVKGSYRSK